MKGFEIYYVSFITSVEKSYGIIEKLKFQHEICIKNRLPVKFIIFSTVKTESLEWANTKSATLQFGTPDQEESFDVLRSLIRDDDFMGIIYFRGILPSPSLIQFISENKSVMEHNTKEVVELQANLTTGNLFKDIYRKLRYGKQLRYGIDIWPNMLKGLTGGVAVTNEIKEFQKSFYKNYECKVVSNGSYFNDTFDHSFTNESKKIKFAFLLGSLNVWQGIDRLIDSLSSIQDQGNFEIHIAGKLSKEHQLKLKEFGSVEFHGILKGESLDAFLKQVHVGIGTLELYRKNMEEACPLKVRKYFEYGLPVLLGYTDIDVSLNPRFNSYVYQVENNNSIIDFDSVVQWAKQLYQDPDIKINIFNLGRECLSIETKTLELYNSLVSFKAEKRNVF